MENKEEAEIYTDIADYGLRTAEMSIDTAILYLEEAQRLYPTERARKLLEQVRDINEDADDDKGKRIEDEEDDEEKWFEDIWLIGSDSDEEQMIETVETTVTGDKDIEDRAQHETYDGINEEKGTEATPPIDDLITKDIIELCLVETNQPNCDKKITKPEVTPDKRITTLLKVHATICNDDTKINRFKEIAGCYKDSSSKVYQRLFDQSEAIRRVNEAKDDYEIMGVPKDTPWSEIKRTHKLQQRLLHPDRNRAPEATEALIAINKAAERLRLN